MFWMKTMPTIFQSRLFGHLLPQHPRFHHHHHRQQPIVQSHLAFQHHHHPLQWMNNNNNNSHLSNNHDNRNELHKHVLLGQLKRTIFCSKVTHRAYHGPWFQQSIYHIVREAAVGVVSRLCKQRQWNTVNGPQQRIVFYWWLSRSIRVYLNKLGNRSLKTCQVVHGVNVNSELLEWSARSNNIRNPQKETWPASEDTDVYIIVTVECSGTVDRISSCVYQI